MMTPGTRTWKKYVLYVLVEMSGEGLVTYDIVEGKKVSDVPKSEIRTSH